MADKIRVLLTEEEVDKRINEVAAKISEEYAGKEIHLICILRAGYSLPVNWQKGLRYPYPWISCPYPAMGLGLNPAVLCGSLRTWMSRWQERMC